MNQNDIEQASPTIIKHFNHFGLTVHHGDKRTNETSKTEAMHIAKPGQQSQPHKISNIEITDNKYFSFCNKFKYLGSMFSNTLDDTDDIEKRIKQATAAFATLSENVLRKKEISKKLRKRTYKALVINLLLWGSESWVLKEKDRQRLESCHHKCIRRMLNITIYDIQEQRITNQQVREKMDNILSINQMMELRRARWLQKIATAIGSSVDDNTQIERKTTTNYQAWIRQMFGKNVPRQQTKNMDTNGTRPRQMGRSRRNITKPTTKYIQTTKTYRKNKSGDVG
jgi:hypothetical protein